MLNPIYGCSDVGGLTLQLAVHGSGAVVYPSGQAVLGGDSSNGWTKSDALHDTIDG
jgi:hypothetical protein